MKDKIDLQKKTEINIWQDDLIQTELIDTKKEKKKKIVLLINQFANNNDKRNREQTIKLINDLVFQEILPSHVIFMNDTVVLARKASPIESPLNFLYQHEVILGISTDSISQFLAADDKLNKSTVKMSIHQINATLFSADLVITY